MLTIKKHNPAAPTWAAEALFLIVIDPVVEAVADAHAYGFRKKRSSQDAVRDIVERFGLLHNRQWILKADVKGCFDHLSHDWIMRHIVFDKTLMHRILKCGYVYQNRRYALDEGMPQGGVLSPAITTFVLSGFEKVLEAEFAEYDVRMVRFVDDFIFSAENPVVLDNVRVRLSAFLAERGLWLAPEKTRVLHISEGVDFIGWHFQKDGSRLVVAPSEWSRAELLARMEEIIFSGHKWSARRLILRLNEVVRGWGNYHAYLCPPDYFMRLDDAVNDCLWRWAVSKWQEKSVSWIYAHHWRTDAETGRKHFSSRDAVLLSFADIAVKMPAEIDYAKNPYIDFQYFRKRGKVWYDYLPILSDSF